MPASAQIDHDTDQPPAPIAPTAPGAAGSAVPGTDVIAAPPPKARENADAGRTKNPPPAPRLAAAASPPLIAASASAKSVATLDLGALEQRLRDTHAIGVFTKLSLKNQVDDLLDTVRQYHSGQGNSSLQDARQRYDSLMIKVLGLLQDGDPALATSIRGSREAIWNLLADRDQFQKMHL